MSEELQEIFSELAIKGWGEDVDKITQEIERLKEDNKELSRLYSRANNEFLSLYSIIKEVRECINEKLDINSDYVDYDFGTELLRQELLEILDKVEKENDIEFDVLKALNTDLDDDVEMG